MCSRSGHEQFLGHRVLAVLTRVVIVVAVIIIVAEILVIKRELITITVLGIVTLLQCY